MRHKTSLLPILSLLLSLATLTPLLGQTQSTQTAAHANSFAIQNGQFLLDEKPFQFISGEIHYPRIPPEYWRQRLRMARACGLNAITTYVFWNMHEPEKGRFTFKEGADIARFVRIAQEEGLYVILRPGPYVCAEWDFGGFPYWLLNEKGMTIRTRDPKFLQYVQRYFDNLAKQLVPLQFDHGGNILLVQVENEYGSYSNDKVYMGAVKDALRKAGFTTPLFTCDGGSQMPAGYLPGLLPGLNGGSGPEVRQTIDKFFPGGPYIVPEYYPGWLDHWGENKSRVGTAGIVRATERMIANNISFNYYMFHGGTNFGFTSGANFGGNFQPDLTSYDYDAPLDEAGHATPKFLQIRDAILKHLPAGTTIPDVPANPPVVAVPRFELSEVGSLDSVLPKPIHSQKPLAMETVGQDYGFLLYRTHVTGPQKSRLTLKELRDYAVVLLDGKRVGTLDRRRNTKSLTVDVPATGATLDILVENGGRINYGSLLTDNHKGITESVKLGESLLTGWDIYKLPFKSVAGLKLNGKQTEGPTLRRGHFRLTTVGDTFLDMRGWFKGLVWVNGHNLGRYWNIGPQQTLYTPGCWLKQGDNEVVVFDLAPGENQLAGHSIAGLTEPILDELHQEPPVHAARPTPKSLPAITAENRIATGEFTRTDEAQDIKFAAKSGRYLTFQAISSYDGDYASAAEIYLLDAAGKPLPRDGWSIYYAESEETAQEDGRAENMIDDDAATIWHSVWSVSHKPLPVRVVIDLGKTTTCSGFRYVARKGDKPAKTKQFALYLSE